MSLGLNILSLFGNVEADKIQNGESFTHYIYTVKFTNPFELKYEHLEVFFNQIQQQDQWDLWVEIGGNTNHFRKEKNNFEVFEEYIEHLKYISDDDDCELRFEISKEFDENILSVYEFGLFQKYCDNLNLEELLSKLSDILQGNSWVKFNVVDSNIQFDTGTFFFNSKPVSEPSYEERLVIIQRTREFCNSGNLGIYSLLPNDFQVNQHIENSMVQIFNRLKFLLSFVNIFDISQLVGQNQVALTLKGYRQLHRLLDYKELYCDENVEIFAIYQWIYDGGNLSDKIGIARNLISIHIQDSIGVIKLKEGSLNSIRSNFEIYLKQNLKEYVQLKSNISNQLMNIAQKSRDVSDTFVKNFRNALYLEFSFLGVGILFKIVRNDFSQTILTPENIIVMYILIFIAFVVLAWSYFEIFSEERALKKEYELLKIRYSDLLVAEDISKILNNDKDFERYIKNMWNKVYRYVALWFVIIAILIFMIQISQFLSASITAS